MPELESDIRAVRRTDATYFAPVRDYSATAHDTPQAREFERRMHGYLHALCVFPRFPGVRPILLEVELRLHVLLLDAMRCLQLRQAAWWRARCVSK